MNQLVVDPNQLSLTESQIAALVVEENVGSLQLNLDIIRQFRLTNRLACKVLCALCDINSTSSAGQQPNNASAATSVVASNGQQANQQGVISAGLANSSVDSRPSLPQSSSAHHGGIGVADYLTDREDSNGCIKEIDLFADYCRQNSVNLQQLLQTFDDEDFISDRLFRNTNFVLQPQKHSSVSPLTAFQRFWQFCTNMASTDKNGLQVVGRVFFTQVWHNNQGFQLNVIANCIEQNLIPKIFLQSSQASSNPIQQQQQFGLNQLVPYAELLKCQPDFDGLQELNNWKFQKLYQILVDFTVPGNIPNLQMNSNCYARVLELFGWPLQYCPDLTVLGLLGVVGQPSAAKVEILSSAIPTFLNASHPNAAIILHSIWSNDSHSSDQAAITQQKQNIPLTWSQKTLLQALSDHYTKSPAEEQQHRLSRILDVAQDIKTLFRLLDGTCYPFVIDLACLASRREYLKLDKWLMDKFTENGENFIRALNSFLTKRYLPLLSGTNKDSTMGPVTMGGPTLPAETLAIMLTFLQQCMLPTSGQLSTPFSELSQSTRKEVCALVGNSSLLLQRAPRQPPPGVATSLANDFNRVDRLVGFPGDRSGQSDIEKLQAEFDAKRLAHQRALQRQVQASNPPMIPPVTRPSIANNTNIENLLAAGSSENYPIPPEVIQDKVFFIVNNLSQVNLKQKAEEFKELFGNDDTYYSWTAQYFSTKRAALEQNFQPLYANFLHELKNPKLIEAMTRETYRNIKHLLRLDKKADNINERTVLKNLGQWLGLLTLARNKPILHVDLDLKGLLVEAYHKGTQELLYVVPFLAEILKTTQKSKIFKPNNPFVLCLLRALVELRQQPNLKLNLEFQVEVLFNNLGVDLNKLVGQSNILTDEKYYSRIEPQLGTKQVSSQQGAQPLMQQAIKAQLQQQSANQQINQINTIMARPGEFGSSLSPLNTPPLISMGGSSGMQGQVGQGIPSGMNNSTVWSSGWISKFKYSDLDVTNTASLNTLITVQPGLAILSLQPSLKSAVKLAFEQAISDWLPTILEKSLKICLPTVERITKKDFAFDTDETHMQRGAHSLVRHLVSYMAMMPCRDPDQLENSLTTHLKVAFTRACPNMRKDQLDHAALAITADNLDLARAFIIKTAVERALADIDKLLQSEYELRRSARLEGQQYFDPEYLSYQRKLVFEGIRIRSGPMNPDQMVGYEEIGQNVAGFKRFDLLNNQMISNRIMTPNHFANQQLPNQLEALEILQTSNRGQSANFLMQSSVNTNHNFANTSPQMLVNENLRLRSNQATTDQIRNYDEVGQNVAGFKRFDLPFDSNVGTTSSFNESASGINIPPLVTPNSANIGKASPMGASGINASMVNQLISNRVITPNQFANQPLPNLDVQSCLEILQTTARSQSANFPIQSQVNANPTFTNTSPQMQVTKTSPASLLQQRETAEADPPGLVEKTERLLREWVAIHQTGQSVKMFPVLVQQMTAHGILKTDDLVTRFFRLSTEMCVESCYRLLATQTNGPNSLELRNKCYETLDAFTMLIVLLIKNTGSSSSANLAPEPAAKINLLSKILSIIANVAIKDQEIRQADFQHLAYYRILILLFIELNLSLTMLGLPAANFNNFNQITSTPEMFAENVQFQVLNEFAKTLKTLRPSRVPSFAFAWLDFLSHRLFVEKCLFGYTPNRPPGTIYKGWALYAQLLIDLVKFEAPFLRNVELPHSVDLLYKGTLKMFLVLLHDFPEFLCEYCYSLCDVIPCNAIQLRNLVLSAFPRKMRLPDPFTPNLKIDQLPEMSQPPKTGAIQNNSINTAPFKDELDSYLRTRQPSHFLGNLNGYLRNQYLISLGGQSTTCSLNVPLLNALVLYVGQSAISAVAPRPISMTSIANTTQMEVFQHLASTLDTEGRYLFLNAIANQLRYPNSHTHYFSSALLYLFVVAQTEQIQEQITRVLVERLIIMRPHPWGLLVTFIELIKNPLFKFWRHDFVRCAPEIEKLFESVARSCCAQNTGVAQKGK